MVVVVVKNKKQKAEGGGLFARQEIKPGRDFIAELMNEKEKKTTKLFY